MMNAVKSKTTQANVAGVGLWLGILAVVRRQWPGLAIWPEAMDAEVIGAIAGLLGTLTARGWRFWRDPSKRKKGPSTQGPYDAAVALMLSFSLAMGAGGALSGCVTDDEGNTRLDLPTVIAAVDLAITYWERYDAARDAQDAADAAAREAERSARLAELRPLAEALRAAMPDGAVTRELWLRYLDAIGASAKSMAALTPE